MNPLNPRLHFLIRAAALLLDAAVLAAVFVQMGMSEPFGRALYTYRSGYVPLYDVSTLFQATIRECRELAPGCATILGIMFLSEWLFAASPAKIFLGMRIRDGDTGPATFSQLFFRALYKNAFLVSFFVALATQSLNHKEIIGAVLEVGVACQISWLVGLIFAAGSRRQALHDRFTGTAVYWGQEAAQVRTTGGFGR